MTEIGNGLTLIEQVKRAIDAGKVVKDVSRDVHFLKEDGEYIVKKGDRILSKLTFRMGPQYPELLEWFPSRIRVDGKMLEGAVAEGERVKGAGNG